MNTFFRGLYLAFSLAFLLWKRTKCLLAKALEEKAATTVLTADWTAFGFLCIILIVYE